MRSSLRSLASIAVACLALVASSPGRASDAASDVVAAIAHADWNTTFEAWKSRRPDAVCRAYHGDSAERSAEEMFCQACRVEADGVSTEWLFYAYGDEEPPHCRLYQVRRVVAGAPELPGLDAALSAHLGPATRLAEPCKTRVRRGCAYFSEFRRWEHEGLEVVAYRHEAPSGAGPSLVISGQSPSLDAARALDDEIRREWDEDRFPELVAAELGERAAGFREALGGDVEAVRAELQALRDGAQASEGPERHLLAVAADVMAERLGRVYHQAGRAFPEGLPEGLTFEQDRDPPMLNYRHDLLRTVLQDAPEGTVARDLATVKLLEMRGDPIGDCSSVDPFREVVRVGSSFLAKRPDTKFRLEVAFRLAQAYETWWSVSQASENDEYVQRAVAQVGAEEARQRAVELYTEIVQLQPESEHARHARFVLPRLRLGIDTNERSVMCMSC